MNSLINALKSVVDAFAHPPVLSGFVRQAEDEINTLIARVEALEALINRLTGVSTPAPAEAAPVEATPEPVQVLVVPEPVVVAPEPGNRPEAAPEAVTAKAEAPAKA